MAGQDAVPRYLKPVKAERIGKIMRGKIIKTCNRALFPLCGPPFGCEILNKGEMRTDKRGRQKKAKKRLEKKPGLAHNCGRIISQPRECL
jgi:hypothetical protein